MGYSSHLEIVKAVLKKYKPKRILELGTGDFSTYLLKGKGTTHYDNNQEWLDKYGKGKQFKLVKDWYKVRFPKCDLAFVDFAPGEPRGDITKKLANKAKIIICHDTEETVQPSASNYSYDFYDFKYKKHFDKVMPHTTVLSNTVNLDKWIV